MDSPLGVLRWSCSIHTDWSQSMSLVNGQSFNSDVRPRIIIFLTIIWQPPIVWFHRHRDCLTIRGTELAVSCYLGFISWPCLTQIFLSCRVTRLKDFTFSSQSSFFISQSFRFYFFILEKYRSLVFCCRMVLLLLLMALPCQGLEWWVSKSLL